jgi:hypothetical protein
MDSNKEWAKIRGELKDIRDRNLEAEDLDLKNLAVIIDMLLISSYMPENLHVLYDIVDEYLMDTLGGPN